MHPNRKYSDAVYQEIRDLHAQGWGCRKIGRKLGIGHRYVYKLCRLIWKLPGVGMPKGDNHPMWRGGRHIEKPEGYILIHCPDHPHANHAGYVREHRLVMEKKLGRHLRPTEVVHHKNGNPADNRIRNLQLFENNGSHLAHELQGKCPRWTDAGKKRLAKGVQKAIATNRRRARIRLISNLSLLAADGWVNNEMSPDRKRTLAKAYRELLQKGELPEFLQAYPPPMPKRGSHVPRQPRA